MEESGTLNAARGREGREKSHGSGVRGDCKQPDPVPLTYPSIWCLTFWILKS
jgi:hypothetical protein